MRLISTLIVCLSFHFLALSQNKTNPILIEWNDEQQLKWNDFMGEKPEETILGDAETIYSIEILPASIMVDENNNIVNYKDLDVATYFHADKSWVSDEKDALLRNQQLKFDIAELHARMMRKEFEKLKAYKTQDFDSYQKVYSVFWAKCREMQKQSNNATNRGVNLNATIDWEDKVYKELKALEEFAR